MRAVLLIDFGSTYTKCTAVDLSVPRILGSAQAHTTATTDLSIGLEEALAKLQAVCGPLQFEKRLACSSAAGGLRMVACGLVPGLTSKAARLAAFGAGAKVIHTFAYKLTDEDLAQIAQISPDILLLCGGIDGGNSDTIIHNAGKLAQAAGNYPVLIAGNRNAQEECAALLSQGPHPVYRAPNVMPEMNQLNIEPAGAVIREIFLQRIIQAKGLSRITELIDGILMPTPSAVQHALSLLAKGTKQTKGLGELLAVDLGGATTDVYSIASGDPQTPGTLVRGLPEPYIKRTVEGDLGMRHNARGVLDAVGEERLRDLCGLPHDSLNDFLATCAQDPAHLPANEAEQAADRALAAAAIATAFARHAGTLTRVYTPIGQVYEQTGKDLSQVKRLIVTGGALVYAGQLQGIISQALGMQEATSLLPKQVSLSVDRHYLLYAMGLLSMEEPEHALRLMLEFFGREEAYAAV